MKASRSIALLAAVAVALPALVINLAHAEPATQPTADTKVSRKTPKVIKPYAELKSLSDDQKIKIDDIHDASVKEIKKLRDKEEEDILAVLTAEQKSELKALEEDASAKKKEKQAKKDK